jgi:glycosyltransferase involved in cell wall biosynthesis
LHEHPTLNRLSIGLIGEGVQLTRIVPEQLSPQVAAEGEQRVALAARLLAPMRVLPWLRRNRCTRLAEAMEKSRPDVFYAIGEQTWGLALDIGRFMERPVVIDVWSAQQVRKVPRPRRNTPIAAYIASTHTMADALRERLGSDLVCHVPTGVAIPTEGRLVLAEAERSIALVIIGRGHDVPAYRALLSGLSRVVNEMPQTQVFLELAGPKEHEIWQHARRLELLGNISGITDAAQHRSLLTHCDMLLMPERFGEMRSLVLEAMAYGLPVVMSHDPVLDMLVDGETAAVVSGLDAGEWARTLRRLLSEPETAREIGRAARTRIEQRHRSTVQVEQLLETFQRVAAGGAYPFAAAKQPT